MNSPEPWLLVTGDFVRTGGMDIANYMLARHLALTGREVHLVAHRVADDLASLPGVHVHFVPKPLNSYLLASPLLEWYGRRWARWIARRGGRVVVNGGNCWWGDVNWVHYVHAAYAPVSKLGLLRRIKARVQHLKFRSDERRNLAQASVVIANSHRTKRDLITLLNVPEEKIRVVYYGVESGAFRTPTTVERASARDTLGWEAHRLKAVFVGALADHRKGFDLLFSAWRQLCSDPEWDVDLVVIGVGSELSDWQSRTAEAPLLKGRIEFLGFRDDVPRILAAVDLLIAPVRYEAYGLGVHEAICSGVPAIVTRSAGVAERYPAELDTLLVDDPPTVAELVKRVRFWRKNQEARRDSILALSGLLRARSWEAMADEFVSSFTSESEVFTPAHKVETST